VRGIVCDCVCVCVFVGSGRGGATSDGVGPGPGEFQEDHVMLFDQELQALSGHFVVLEEFYLSRQEFLRLNLFFYGVLVLWRRRRREFNQWGLFVVLKEVRV